MSLKFPFEKRARKPVETITQTKKKKTKKANQPLQFKGILYSTPKISVAPFVDIVETLR